VSIWGLTWGLSWGNTWGLTRVEESARSGYWRLALYQLQEEWLAKRKEKPVPLEQPMPVIEVRYVKDATQKPGEKPLPKASPQIPPQVKLAPLKLTAVLPSDQYFTIFELNQWLEFTIAPIRDKVATMSVQPEALDAANDEILLLLLSA